MVSRHIWVPKGCPGKYGHWNGAQAHMGTGRVPGHMWTLEWCPGTYGHWNGARAHVDTGKNARAKIDTVEYKMKYGH